MNKKRVVWFIIIVLTTFIISNFAFYKKNSQSDDNEKANNIIVADYVYEGINSELEKPVVVARSFAGDPFLSEFVLKEKNYSKNEAVLIMQDYLTRINKTAGFDCFFFISDSTKRYYMTTGLNKTIDPNNDSDDIWYNVFMNSQNDYSVEVDEDQYNDGKLTIYVDVKVYDAAGNVIGICGVGKSINNIQTSIKEIGDSFNMKIQVTDKDGLVQIDDVDSNIKTMYCDSSTFAETDECIYQQKGGHGFYITRFIECANWYVVMEKESTSTSFSNIDGSFIIYSSIVFAFLSVVAFLTIGRNRFIFRYDIGDEEQYDGLTGVPNRNYFKEIYGERGVYNTTIYKSMAVFDIDNFKEANDTVDGDEVLKRIVELTKECFGDKGEIFRWGGDEFMVMLEWSIEFAHEMCKELCKKIEEDGRVTISLGVTEIRLAENIKKNYHRACQACYFVKEMGGNGVKRN